MKVGAFVSGRFQTLPDESFLSLGAESILHQVYELRIKTTPMSADDENVVTSNLLHVHNPGMNVLGVDVRGSSVRMQVTGSPFFWAPLIAALPALIGPILLFVIGLIVVIRIPDWAYALPFLALGGGIIAYAVLKGRQPSREPAVRIRWGPRPAKAKE